MPPPDREILREQASCSPTSFQWRVKGKTLMNRAVPYNVIVILLDSLRQDYLDCYGDSRVHTPNLDRLAKDCVIFDNAYPEALPSMPVRMSLWTGQRTLPFRSWQPLAPEDVTLAEILDEHGYVSALITDDYHLFKPDMNYHRGFHVFRWIRGQEADAYESAPHGKNLEDYLKPAMRGDPVERMLDQYLRNTAFREKEEDYFCAQVMREAIRWLERNYRRRPFFLFVDSFDPHEPWDPPPEYEAMYADPNYSGPRLIHPKYGPVDWMTPEELEYVRALYNGEVTFVDRWTGELLSAAESLGLMDDTVIVVLSDHGHPHGEHGQTMKTDDNLYSELLRIPLLLRHPDRAYAGKRIPGLVETDDFVPGLLDLLGLSAENPAMHGKSFWPLVTGEAEKLRDYVITGYHESAHRCIRDLEWSYIHRPAGEPCELYHLTADPGEQRNVANEFPEKVEEMERRLPRGFQLTEPKIAAIQLRYELSDTPVVGGHPLSQRRG